MFLVYNVYEDFSSIEAVNFFFNSSSNCRKIQQQILGLRSHRLNEACISGQIYQLYLMTARINKTVKWLFFSLWKAKFYKMLKNVYVSTCKYYLMTWLNNTLT